MSTRIIAEIAQAHDGSLGIAHSYIDALASIGIKEIKFQIHYAAEESTPHEPFRVKTFPQDLTRYEYWKRMEFSVEQWTGLKKHCDALSINMVASPFSLYAVDLCKKLDIQTIKIGSGEVGNKRLLESAARKASEIIISSGMSSWDELDAAFNHTYSINSNISLLHCVSKYPCPLELVGLENLKLIKERYACKTGLSDHSGKLAPALCAVSSGIADLVEVHVTYNRMCFGPDSTSSLELNELKLLVELVKDIDIITNSSTSKDDIAHQLADVKKIFGRSIFSARALPKGSVLELSDLNFKKPGYFLGPENIDLVIGKTLVCDIDFDQPILEYHLS